MTKNGKYLIYLDAEYKNPIIIYFEITKNNKKISLY